MDIKTEPVDESISYKTVEIVYDGGLHTKNPNIVQNVCSLLDDRYTAQVKQEQIDFNESEEDNLMNIKPEADFHNAESTLDITDNPVDIKQDEESSSTKYEPPIDQDKNSRSDIKFKIRPKKLKNSADGPKRIDKPSTSKKCTNSQINPRTNEASGLVVDKTFVENPSTVNSAIGNYLDEVWNTAERKKTDDEKDPKSASWKRNRVIKAREIGDKYESIERKKNHGGKTGKTVLREARVLKPRCDSLRCGASKVARQCSTVSDQDRQGIFNSFWQHMSWEQRKLYVNALVEKTSTKRTCNDINTSRRENTLKYFLDINFQRVPVCKRMFLSTLSLGEWTVLSWVKKANVPTKNVDRRNKKNVLKLEHVTCFLRTLPKSPFYDSDESSTKDYLELSYRTIRDVYRAFEKYFSDSSKPLDEKGGYNMFRKQMESMNLAIFQPRKE